MHEFSLRLKGDKIRWTGLSLLSGAGGHGLPLAQQKPTALMTRLKIGFAALLFSGTLIVSWCVHFRADLAFPVLWNDEPWYLFPAVSFAETGSVFSPYILPDRIWMGTGHGYSVLMGVVFKCFGVSPFVARHAAWVFMIGVLACLAGMINELRWYALGWLLSAAFIFSAAFVVTGNSGRPDAALLCVCSLGFLLLCRDQPWKGLSILAAGLTIHPNALYFFAAGVVSVLVEERGFPPRPKWSDLPVVGVCAVCVLASAGLVLLHFESFRHDFLEVGMRFKAGHRPMSHIGDSAPIIVVLAVCTSGAVLQRSKGAFLGWYGLACAVVFCLGREMWYQVFHHLSFLVALLVAVEVIQATAQRIGGGVARMGGIFLAAGVTAFALSYFLRHGMIEGPRNYFDDISWGWGMTMPGDVAYFTEEDREAVVSAISELAAKHRVRRVEFARGDALLFYGSLPGGMTPYYPVNTPVRGDLLVYHVSRYNPPWVHDAIRAAMERDGVGEAAWIRCRDNTECWYVSSSGSEVPHTYLLAAPDAVPGGKTSR